LDTAELTSAHELTASQRARIARLGDTDPTRVDKALSYRPTDVYVSRERFDLEIERLFRGRPVPIAVSADLPSPRSQLAIKDYELPVLLTRDEEGVAHAFVNVCPHRAVELCPSSEPRSGGLIVCPYHAWSFSMRGDLVAVPREEAFPGLEKSRHGLVRLECVEAGGLIWVNLDPKTKADFSLVTGALGEELAAIAMSDQHIFKKVRFELNSNWKLTHDAFLENYHIARLHSKSLGTMFVDRSTVCEQIGPHICHLSGRVGFERGERRYFEDFRKHGVFCYTIIGGAIIITSPDYISVMLLSPKAPDKTIVNYYMMVDQPPANEAQIAHFERAVALMLRITTEEDFWAAELGTIGARTGVVPQMVLGGMEQEILRFHRTLEAELEG
jgi:phenylpropionate dioxygenase-like ring-hydroxylating dioxygenase large terminal subunit